MLRIPTRYGAAILTLATVLAVVAPTNAQPATESPAEAQAQAALPAAPGPGLVTAPDTLV
jgi:hypothetical protein